VLGAHLTGGQEVPPTGSSNTGDATFVVNPDLSITYSVQTTITNATAAHIHTAPFGSNGSVLFPLSGGPQNWSGTTAKMTPAQFGVLQTQGMYVNVHTPAFPAGEIRGQITPTHVPYGVPCPCTAATPVLSVSGAAQSNGTLTIAVQGGLPSGSGILFTSLSDGAVQAKGACSFLLGAPLYFAPIKLDPGGSVAVPVTLPALGGAFDLYLQYIGLCPGSPNGKLYNTNATKIPFAF